MPDYRVPPDEPRNWSEAFSALPLASPEEDLWAQLKAEVPAPVAPIRRRRWTAAAAAVLVMALLLPVAWMQRAPPAQPAAGLARLPAASTAAPAAGAPASLDTPRNEGQGPVSPPASASTVSLPGAAPATTPNPGHDSSTPEAGQASTALAGTSAPALVIPRSSASRSSAPKAGKPQSDGLAANASRADPLPARYARSAQLESLLAEIRDDRVTSGAAATLADEYESRLALIDASLSDPSLSQAARVGLWDERIEALQQLVAFAGTQRWLNAQGESYDGQLVSVY